MADPLRLLGGSNAPALRGLGGGVGGADPNATDENGKTFKDSLMQSINEVNQLQAEATQAQEDLAAGRRPDLENVILATQKADTAFRTLLAVRNKVQAAYDELKQVRI
jgi:flagellar hook-basal body complex protein FliE